MLRLFFGDLPAEVTNSGNDCGAQIFRVHGDGHAPAARGTVEPLEGFPAHALVAVTGDEDDVRHDAVGLTFEGALENPRIEVFDLGEYLDDGFAGSDVLETALEVVLHEYWEMIPLPAHAEFRHLADGSHLGDHRLGVDGGSVGLLVLEVFQLLGDGVELLVFPCEVLVERSELTEDGGHLTKRGALFLVVRSAQIVEAGGRAMLRNDIRSIAQQLLLLVDLAYAIADNRNLALILPARLLEGGIDAICVVLLGTFRLVDG